MGGWRRCCRAWGEWGRAGLGGVGRGREAQGSRSVHGRWVAALRKQEEWQCPCSAWVLAWEAVLGAGQSRCVCVVFGFRLSSGSVRHVVDLYLTWQRCQGADALQCQTPRFKNFQLLYGKHGVASSFATLPCIAKSRVAVWQRLHAALLSILNPCLKWPAFLRLPCSTGPRALTS